MWTVLATELQYSFRAVPLAVCSVIILRPFISAIIAENVCLYVRRGLFFLKTEQYCGIHLSAYSVMPVLKHAPTSLLRASPG